MSRFLSKNQKDNIKSETEVPQLKFGAGSDSLGGRDFILARAISNDGVTLGTKKFIIDSEVGDNLSINLANYVNSIGVLTGDITLEYNFLRTVAGTYKLGTIDKNFSFYNGKVINNGGKLYKNTVIDDTETPDPSSTDSIVMLDDIEDQEVFSRKFSYEISGISPTRKEIKIKLKDNLKNNLFYKSQFNNFRSDISDQLIIESKNISYGGEARDSTIIKSTVDSSKAISGQLVKFSNSAKAGEFNIIIEIPDFFIISANENSITTVNKELFIEDKPTLIPTIQDSHESEFGQWKFIRDFSGSTDGKWVLNAEGLEVDSDGNVLYPNNLVTGMPLSIASNASKLQEFSNATIQDSLIPNAPSSIFIFDTKNSSTNFTDDRDQDDRDNEMSYISGVAFTPSFKNWFNTNASGLFFHETFGNKLPNKLILFNFLQDRLDSGYTEVIDGVTVIPEDGSEFNANVILDTILAEYRYMDPNSSSTLYFKDVESVTNTTQYSYAPLITDLQNFQLNTGEITDPTKPYTGIGDKVDNFSINITPENYAKKYGIEYESLNTDIKKIILTAKKREILDLSFSAVIGQSSLHSVLNTAGSDDDMFVKFLNPVNENVQIGDDIYFVRDVMDPQSYAINLVNFIDPIIPTTILRLPNSSTGNNSEPIVRHRQTEYQSYDDLLLTSSSLSQDIERDIVSGSINRVQLNIDYSNLDNFIKFSSAKKRLDNFKTKLEKIELHNAYSQSIAGTYYDTGYLGNDPNTTIENAGTDATRWEIANSEVVNSFDGYERYLYFNSSSYSSGSAGIYYDASWPKQNNTKPYTLYEVSSSQGVEWYNLNNTSASNYDTDNIDRLIYHLPDHIRDDMGNNDFVTFVDMVGHHFDNLKNYIDEFGQIYSIDEALDKGLSKQLVYSVAQGFGWNLQDGYDLAKLDKFYFGKSVDPVNKSTSLYASSSLQDISREIWKRIIANMPFFLKSKGTVEALRGLINCYGIPSTILRVREYGGPTITEVEPIYETSRKFSKALDFKSSQYVSSSWSDSLGLGGTQVPNTVEFRYKAVSSSDMTLVQTGNGTSGDQLGIYLKDNASSDNIGRLSFSLSGSSGYITASTEPLPFYNGDYWSVLLTKNTVSEDLFTNNNFETGSLQVPFKAWANGSSSFSTDAHSGATSIKVTQNNPGSRTYSYPYRNPDGIINVDTGDARFVTASIGEKFEFSMYAKTDGGGVTARLVVIELDTDGRVINWSPVGYPNTKSATGGYHYIDKSISTDWEKISFSPEIISKAAVNISVQLSFTQPSDGPRRSVFFDGGTFNKIHANASGNNVIYNLVAKQYDAGRDVIQYIGKTSLNMPGDLNAVSQSYNTAYNNTGSMYIGGYTTNDFGGQFSGSMMEFRTWKSSLEEKYFDEHVENPQSFTGNSVSASYEDISLRYSFNESKNHNSDTTVRDTSTDQSSPIAGIATGFADETSYSSVVDRTKFPLPKLGGIRRSDNKVRIETAEYMDRIGENINLSSTQRVEVSSFDRSPLDSNRVGVYFSPIDVINQDIINQMSDFNFDNYLGDSRDDTEYQYRGLDQVKEEYFKKYTGANNFWDYLRLLNYFDHSLFKQLESLLPARNKAVVGVLIENNILERNKQPINHPVYENPVFEETINLKDEDGDYIKQFAENEYHEVSQSIARLDREMDEESTYDLISENTYWDSQIDNSVFDKPTLRDLNRLDKFGHFGTNYATSSIYKGGPISVFTESISMIDTQRLSVFNKGKHYIYNSKNNYLVGSASSVSFVTSSFEKITENQTGLRRINFEGSKNTINTALSSIDANGKKNYTPVTYILTNPYTLVGDPRESVQLRTEFDLSDEKDT